MEEIRIDRFHPEDLNAVFRIEKSLFPIPWSKESFLEIAQNETFSMYVARIGKKIFGYMVYQTFSPEAELHNIAVDAKMQGKGVGSQLLLFLKKNLQNQGVHRLYLLVRRSNLNAISFYKKQGFQPMGLRKDYYENKEDAWVLQWDLPH